MQETVRVRLTRQQCKAIARWLARQGVIDAATVLEKMAQRSVRGAADRRVEKGMARDAVKRLYLLAATLDKIFPPVDELKAGLSGLHAIDTALRRGRGRPSKRGDALASAAERVFAPGDDGGKQRSQLRKYRIRLYFEQAHARGETILTAIPKFSE